MTKRHDDDDDTEETSARHGKRRGRGKRTFGFAEPFHYADCPAFLSSSGQAQSHLPCDCDEQQSIQEE